LKRGRRAGCDVLTKNYALIFGCGIVSDEG